MGGKDKGRHHAPCRKNNNKAFGQSREKNTTEEGEKKLDKRTLFGEGLGDKVRKRVRKILGGNQG